MTRAKLLSATLLLAGAALASLPALAQNRAGAPLRTVYIATSHRALPQTAFVRTRDCVNRPRTCVNGVAGQELVYLVEGKLPPTTTRATVLTDTNCAPDAYGISHCTNVLRLANGKRLTVRHDHSMRNDPCLWPGERVHVRVLR